MNYLDYVERLGQLNESENAFRPGRRNDDAVNLCICLFVTNREFRDSDCYGRRWEIVQKHIDQHMKCKEWVNLGDLRNRVYTIDDYLDDWAQQEQPMMDAIAELVEEDGEELKDHELYHQTLHIGAYYLD